MYKYTDDGILHVCTVWLSTWMIFIVSMSSCTPASTTTDVSLEFAGKNASELQEVLNHYRDHKAKYEAALFLIDNLPHWYSYVPSIEMDSIERMLHIIAKNKDIWYFKELSTKNWYSWNGCAYPKVYDSHVITSDYLINHIESTYCQLTNRKWNSNLTVEQFYNFLLPYRIGDEPLSDWRPLYEAKYGTLVDSLYNKGDDSLEAAQIVYDSLIKDGFKYNVCAQWPHRKATDLFIGNAGPCRDECDRQIYALRGAGIPCTVDTYFTSPEHDTSHQWVMVWDNKRERFIRFGPKMKEYRDSPLNNPDVKKCKVYRFMSGLQSERRNWIHGSKGVNSTVRNFYIKDVTTEYLPYNSLEVMVSNPNKRQVMLGVFSPSGWKVIDYAVKSGKREARFKNVETGIIYIPLIVASNGHGVEPCSFPFIFGRDNSVIYLKPESRYEKVTLNRKMPFMSWLNNWFSQGVGKGVVELSLSKEFKNSIKGESLPDTLATNFHPVFFQSVKTRYVRFTLPGEKEMVLGQIEVYSDSSCNKKVGCKVITKFDCYHHPEHVTDGDILSFFVAPKECRSIVLQLDEESTVEAVGIIPRNNDNFVWPSHTYSLMFFKSPEEGWVEVGRKVADGRILEMNAPIGALLWLRDLSKGIEEACFIWRDGRQIFVKDL